MPRTPDQLRKAAAEAEAWLDSLDPAALADPAADATDLRAIGQAVLAVEAAEDQRDQAVLVARRNGWGWSSIALALGVSRRVARERYEGMTMTDDSTIDAEIAAIRGEVADEDVAAAEAEAACARLTQDQIADDQREAAEADIEPRD